MFCNWQQHGTTPLLQFPHGTNHTRVYTTGGLRQQMLLHNCLSKMIGLLFFPWTDSHNKFAVLSSISINLRSFQTFNGDDEAVTACVPTNA